MWRGISHYLCSRAMKTALRSQFQTLRSSSCGANRLSINAKLRFTYCPIRELSGRGPPLDRRIGIRINGSMSSDSPREKGPTGVSAGRKIRRCEGSGARRGFAATRDDLADVIPKSRRAIAGSHGNHIDRGRCAVELRDPEGEMIGTQLECPGNNFAEIWFNSHAV